ncbi:serine hydrolase [Rugosimonospora africana]|uniref:Serine hydrolase n=1 Tax=Rugosimonospora africana TaxID=556532 RepID=A0A8J3QYG5_9ACTN|nr:serine hydrolase [Rugosimonospora africana]GIH18457.1 serine hydrolase [Rugosimonospora africana]
MTAEKLVRELRGMLEDAGLSGSFLVRDLSNGDEIGIDPDLEYPIASLVKVPLAVAVLERVDDGRIDAATMIDVPPGRIESAGPTGLSRFRHPARIAVEDLLYLSTAISDSAAADALFDLVPPAEVHRAMLDAGIAGITVRHPMRDLVDTPAERFEPGNVHLAHSLAIGARTSGRGHAVAQLDVSRANSGTARAFVDLLEALWVPSRIPAGVAERVRLLMAQNVIRHRLAPDFSSDASTWSAKTGTMLNERHEIGVVEHDDGGLFAVAALTESTVPAVIQPAAEAVMARVARILHDHLRG